MKFNMLNYKFTHAQEGGSGNVLDVEDTPHLKSEKSN